MMNNEDQLRRPRIKTTTVEYGSYIGIIIGVTQYERDDFYKAD